MIKSVITIGTGAGYASPERGGAANLVFIDGESILFDCGEGTAGWMNKLHITNDLSVIFISHLHADHIAGLFVLLQNMKILKRKKLLEIFLPGPGINDLSNFISAVYLDPEIDNMPFPIQLKPISVGTLYANPFYYVNAWESDHFSQDILKNREQRPVFGFTLITSETDTLVYTGDITSIECIISELNKKATLVCESTHTSPSEIVDIAKQKHIKRVIFTHIAPDFDGNQQELVEQNDFVSFAKDGQRYIW